MLNRIKCWLIAAALAVIGYLIVKNKGRDDEKIENLERSQKTVAAAARARAGLADPDVVRRLREKYRRG
jgi:2,4-dienoyl-CoA reductase-like NADH-dependent reductase (Old Yellow Enzyme family)